MTRSARDPYLILGVSSDASANEVRKKYRKLCKRFHPDLNQGDSQAEVRFKEIQWAYETVMELKRGRVAGHETLGPPSNFDPVVDASHPVLSFFESMKSYCSTLKQNRRS